MERAAPTQLRYTDTVPLAIPSSSNRREFTSSNGQEFTPGGANVIRIDINSDNYLDTAHSYLQADFKYNSISGSSTFAPDVGPMWINRLSILSGGVLLEDITSYNKLYAFLQLAQSDKDKRQDSVYFNSNIASSSTSLAGAATPADDTAIAGLTGLKCTETQATKGSGIWTIDAIDGKTTEASGTYQVAAGDGTAAAITTQVSQGGSGYGSSLTAAEAANMTFVATAGTGDAPITTAASLVAQGVIKLGPAVVASNWSGRVIDAPIYNDSNKSKDLLVANTMENGETYTYTIPLMSALFNASKYLPICLVNAGLTLEIGISPGYECGVAQINTAKAQGDGTQYEAVDYTISNVKYVAHLIDLDRSFNDVLKAQMIQSGAITLHGHVWRHFQSTFEADQTSVNINIPVRMKSIKGLYTLLRDQARSFKAKAIRGSKDLTTETEFNTFLTGCSTQQRVMSYNYKIGSVMYPQQPVLCGKADNIGETVKNAHHCGPAYCELMKSFNALGDTSASTALNLLTFGRTGVLNGLPGQWVKMFCMAYDVESFSNVASVIESGIDSASRALPISIEIQRQREPTVGNADKLEEFANPIDPRITMRRSAPVSSIIADSFACSDGFFYFNPDGTISPSV